MGLSKCESTLSHRNLGRKVCLSVCPTQFRFQEYCTENSEIDNEMDRVEIIDLCSESKTKKWQTT